MCLIGSHRIKLEVGGLQTLCQSLSGDLRSFSPEAKITESNFLRWPKQQAATRSGPQD